MQLAHSKTREQFPLSQKKIIKKTVAGTLSMSVLLLCLGGGIAFIFSSSDSATGSWIGTVALVLVAFLVLVILLTYLYQRWYFEVYFYDLTPDFIQIKKGPITPKEITIPYERIQDVYVDQDIFDRIFGLYDVHLSSATISSGMEAHIDGVEKEAAEGLRTALLQVVKERISKGRTVSTSK